MIDGRLLGASLFLLLAAGCGDDAGGGSGGSGSASATGGESTASGTECPELSDGPGGEACENDTCEPGDFCEGFTCGPGCENSNTCPQGQYCDLTGADETNAGTCRPPPSGCTESSSPSTGAGTAPTDCDDRCLDKLLSCDFQEQVESPQALCTQLCDALNESTLACLEDASCGALSDGEECGVPFGE